MEPASLYLAPHLEEKKAEVPLAKAAFKFDSTRFRNYAGWYEATERPGFIVKFRREGERYFWQASGQFEFELLPTSDSTFSVQGLDASVVFHSTKEGPVPRMTWRQNGNYPIPAYNPRRSLSSIGNSS